MTPNHALQPSAHDPVWSCLVLVLTRRHAWSWQHRRQPESSRRGLATPQQSAVSIPTRPHTHPNAPLRATGRPSQHPKGTTHPRHS